MTTLLRKLPQIMFSPDEPAAAPAPDTASVLYGDDAPKDDVQPAGLDKDGKPAETDKAEATGDAPKNDEPAPDAALDTVPEDGKYTVEMPEGVELDTALMDRFAPKFKEAGLTQRQVQAIASEFAQLRKDEAEQYMGTPEGQWSAASYEYFKQNGTPDAWADKAKADKEIGGDNWSATVSSAQRAVNELGTPELKQFFEASGGGNHPELIRFMAKVGAMIKEDNPASGNVPGKARQADRAEVLYPDDKPKG